MTPPRTRQLQLMRSEELGEESARSVMVETMPFGVARHRGQLFAFDPLCPHKFSDLCAGLLEDGAIVCPTHLWAFDLHTGSCRNVPGASVATHSVREEDGWIVVELPA